MVNERMHHLVRFERQYLQCVDKKTLRFPEIEDLRSSELQTRLVEILEDPRSDDQHPARDREVAKILWNKLEEACSLMSPEDSEINDRLMSWIVTARQRTFESGEDGPYGRVVYTIPWASTASGGRLDADSVTVYEKPRLLVSHGSTAHRTWDAALHLASLMCLPPVASKFKDKAILELGCGCGFLSLFCIRAGLGKSVAATDCDREALSRLSEAALEQGLGHLIRPRYLNWFEPETSEADLDSVETIVATDVTYEPEIISGLVECITKVSRLVVANGRPSPEIIVVSTVRKPEALVCFQLECERRKLAVSELDLNPTVVDDVCAESQQMGCFHSYTSHCDYKIWQLDASVI